MQLSAIGLAIPQAVNVSQILTTSGFATELRKLLRILHILPRVLQGVKELSRVAD